MSIAQDGWLYCLRWIERWFDINFEGKKLCSAQMMFSHLLVEEDQVILVCNIHDEDQVILVCNLQDGHKIYMHIVPSYKMRQLYPM